MLKISKITCKQIFQQILRTTCLFKSLIYFIELSPAPYTEMLKINFTNQVVLDLPFLHFLQVFQILGVQGFHDHPSIHPNRVDLICRVIQVNQLNPFHRFGHFDLERQVDPKK